MWGPPALAAGGILGGEDVPAAAAGTGNYFSGAKDSGVMRVVGETMDKGSLVSLVDEWGGSWASCLGRDIRRQVIQRGGGGDHLALDGENDACRKVDA